MTYNSVRVGRQNVVGVVGVGVGKTAADGDVGNVEDDAENANDDDCDADDCRLDMAVRADNGSGLVRLNDVLWLSGHHRRLLLLCMHRAVLCLYTDTP